MMLPKIMKLSDDHFILLLFILLSKFILLVFLLIMHNNYFVQNIYFYDYFLSSLF